MKVVIYAAGLVQLLFVIAAQAEVPLYLDRMIEREGISMHLRMEAVDDHAPAVPVAGQQVRLWLEGKRLADNQPLSNWPIGAWLDRQTDVMSGAVPVCGQRVGQYLSGNLVHRPLLDLTGYYVLSLDDEPSISVLDPSVSFSGRSSLYTAMQLEGKGFDWVKTSDDAELFVALPEEKKLAVADLQMLQILDTVELQGKPTRLALQPDERLLWIGQTGDAPEQSRVTVFDTVNKVLVADIQLSPGYHEFAFSNDDRMVFASSRQSKTVTLIDANRLEIVRELRLNYEPISLTFDDQQQLLWIIDGRHGVIHRYDSQGTAVDKIQLDAGLGPARLSPDARYMFVVNPSQHWLHVFDTANGKEKHRISISGQPYDVLFSEQYAYIRTLQSELVGLVSLSSLEDAEPILKFVPAGAKSLSEVSNLLRASSMALTLDRSGAFFANPAERTLHYYMEGMNAPSSSLRTYGHVPMATMVVQSGLREIKPGLYSAVIRLPAAGNMVLALASEAPIVRECLGLKIGTSKQTVANEAVKARWMNDSVQTVAVGNPVNFRLEIGDELETENIPGNLFYLRIVPAQGGRTIIWPLKNDPDTANQWVAEGVLSQTGGYYVYVEGEQPINAVYATVLVNHLN